MGTVKDIFDIIKDLTSDIKQMVDKAAANELISKLIDIQALIIDSKAENQQLNDKIRELTLELEESKKNILPENIKWSIGGIGKFIDSTGDNYICRFCYDEHHKIYHVQCLSDRVFGCSKCNKRYYYFNDK